MTWTYTTPYTTTRDYVRFLIQDTDSTSQIFQDEELDNLLTQNGSDPRLAAAEALEALASKYARNAFMYSVGISAGFSMDRRGIAKELLNRAKVLREEALAIPFEFESTLDHYVDAQGLDRSNYDNSAATGDAA